MTSRWYRVSEMFQSIQGEGKTVGKNSVFIRLMGCNMKCNWCDSKFTWNDYNTTNVTHIEEDLIYKLKNYNTTNVVFTGGEPLIETSLPFLVRTLVEEMGMTVEIETNGSIELNEDWKHLYGNKNILFNISPKLNNSGMDYSMYYAKRNSLEQIMNNFDYIFKFVVSNNENDFQELEEKFVTKYNVPSNKVYIMAEGMNRDKQISSSTYIIPIVMSKGYNFGVRAHTLIWDNKKGV